MKYELIPVTHGGTKRYQIKATASFGNVKKGQVGGFVDSELNLSQKGNSWIYDDAIVFERGYVGGDAKVMDSAMVYGNAVVSGSAIVQDEAKIYGNAVVTDQANVYGWSKVFDKAFVGNKSQAYGDVRIYGSAKITGKASVKDRAQVYGNARITDNGVVSGNSEIYGSAFIGYNDKYHNMKTNLTSTMSMESVMKSFKDFIKEGKAKGPDWSKYCFACNKKYDVFYCETCKKYNYDCSKCDDEYEYNCTCKDWDRVEKFKKVKRPTGTSAPGDKTFSLDSIVRALGQSDVFKDFKDAKGQKEYDKFLDHNKEFKNIIDKYFTNTDKFSVGDRLHYHQQLDKSLKAFLTKLIAGKL